MNAIIKKTQMFNKMKYDLKDHSISQTCKEINK